MARVSPITWAPQIDISPIPAEEHAAVKHVINLLMLLANYERNFRIAVALFDGSHAEKSRLARRSNHPWPRLRNYPANPYLCETFPINAAPAEFVHRSVDRARSKAPSHTNHGTEQRKRYDDSVGQYGLAARVRHSPELRSLDY
jgi:hypothetical protein